MYSWLRKLGGLIGLGAALASTPTTAQNQIDPGTGVPYIAPVTLVAETKTPAYPSESAINAMTLLTVKGVATYYGSEKDMFGYVRTTDALVQAYLAQNHIELESLPEKVRAVDVLTETQIRSLFAIDPEKYALLTAYDMVFDSRENVIAMDKEFLGKYAEVYNPTNGRRVIVRVVDTGNFSNEKWAKGKGVEVRLADLSKGVSDQLDIKKGTVRISILKCNPLPK